MWVLLNDGERENAWLKVIVFGDVKAKGDQGRVVVGRGVIGNGGFGCAGGCRGGCADVGGGERVFDEGGTGDEGNVIQVDDLEELVYRRRVRRKVYFEY